LPTDEKPKFKKIESAGTMKKIMADHFYELDAAAKDPSQKVAWCTSVGPAELLRGMGYHVFFPENHGAMLGATRKAMEYIPLANAQGYSPDICSYLTSDIGSFLKGETPISMAYEGIEGVPKPDVLVYNTNQCRDVKDWFSWYGRHWDVPVLGVETYRGVGKVTDAHVEGVAQQFEAMVDPLEKIADRQLDMQEFKNALSLSKECTEYWKKVLFTSTAIPSPFTFFDGTIHMGPAVVARGTQEAVDYYKMLLAELEQRVEDKVAAIDGEQYRLYWEGMPIWGKLRDLSTQFMSLNTCVVASTYCNSWVFDAFDPSDPYRSMARAYTELFIVREDEYKEDYISRMHEAFRFDGIIYHDAKTCPNNTNSRYGMPQRLQERLGTPGLVIHGDLNDLRLYSEEQAKTNIEAFIEGLAENKE